MLVWFVTELAETGLHRDAGEFMRDNIMKLTRDDEPLPLVLLHESLFPLPSSFLLSDGCCPFSLAALDKDSDGPAGDEEEDDDRNGPK